MDQHRLMTGIKFSMVRRVRETSLMYVRDNTTLIVSNAACCTRSLVVDVGMKSSRVPTMSCAFRRIGPFDVEARCLRHWITSSAETLNLELWLDWDLVLLFWRRTAGIERPFGVDERLNRSRDDNAVSSPKDRLTLLSLGLSERSLVA